MDRLRDWGWSMSRSICRLGTMLLLALVVTGCGGKPEDKLVSEQLVAYEKLAGIYSGVIDEQSMKAAEPEISAIFKKLGEADKKLTELGQQRKEAALGKRAVEVDQAKKNWLSAKRKAGEALGAKR